jgi:hypothetical protein
MTVGRVIAKAHAAWTPTITAQQIRGDARFIDEDVAPRIVQGEGVLPPASARSDVSAALFVGEDGFF